MQRRDVLKLTLAALGSGLAGTRVCAAGTAPRPRLVLLNLRGGLDALAVAAPYGEPAYARLRGGIALPSPASGDGLLALDGLFGLHPALAALHRRYEAGELALVHAVATAYRERSHFDAQKVLENGTGTPASVSGWLNRAAGAAPGLAVLAVGASVPLVARGPAPVTSWSPSLLPGLDADTLARIEDLYNHDAFFAARLASALDAPDGTGMTPRGRRRQGIAHLVEPVAALLRAPGGPDVVALDWGGWDTHANQGGIEGGLALRLAQLDASLEALAGALGTLWAETMVLVVTEFGRTVRANGTRGTDHGTGALALALGGAVRGGRIIADWPGLAGASLYEGRDLRPTRDLRTLFAGALVTHLGLDAGRVAHDVFPGADVPPLALT